MYVNVIIYSGSEIFRRGPISTGTQSLSELNEVDIPPVLIYISLGGRKYIQLSVVCGMPNSVSLICRRPKELGTTKVSASLLSEGASPGEDQGSIMSGFVVIDSDGSVSRPVRSESPFKDESCIDDGYFLVTTEEGHTFVFDGLSVDEYHFNSPGSPKVDSIVEPWPEPEVGALTLSPLQSVTSGIDFDLDISYFGGLGMDNIAVEVEEILEDLEQTEEAENPSLEETTTTTDTTSTDSAVSTGARPAMPSLAALSPEVQALIMSLRVTPFTRPIGTGVIAARGLGSYPFSLPLIMQMRAPTSVTALAAGAPVSDIGNSYYVPVQDDDSDIDEFPPGEQQPQLFFVKREESTRKQRDSKILLL